MHFVEQSLTKTFHTYAHHLQRPLYLACSGGRDSLSLAFACLRLYHQGMLACLPTLIHINHQLQIMADDWADGVADFANTHGFACHIVRVSLTHGTENEARTARYQACFEIMADDGVLLLAHHQGDQAETVLMRLIAGAGQTGLSGIKLWQTRQTHGKTLHLFRPYLSLDRDAISDYAHYHALPYVDDPTNKTGDNVRAKIRNELLPILQTINPKVIQNIARTAHVIAQESHILTDYLAGELAKLILVPTFGNEQTTLDITRLHAHPSPTQYALLRLFVQGNSHYGADFAFIESVFELCHRTDGDHNTRLFWQGTAGGVVICRYRHRLYRYHAKLWHALQGASEYQQGVGIVLSPYCQSLPNFVALTALDTQTKIAYRHSHLSGKKLYQTLGIPTWLRPHLYLAHWQQDEQTCQCLVSAGHTWELGMGVVSLGELMVQ